MDFASIATRRESSDPTRSCRSDHWNGSSVYFSTKNERPFRHLQFAQDGEVIGARDPGAASRLRNPRKRHESSTSADAIGSGRSHDPAF
jgi:hypothetical protein